MIYLRSSKKTSWKKHFKLYSVILLVLLLAGIFLLFRGGLQSLALTAFSPFFRVFHSMVDNVALGSRIFVPDYKLEKENVALTEEIARLRQNVADLEVAKKENDELRIKLNFKQDNFLPTSILLSPPRTPYDDIIIDRGEYDGVAAGQRVLLGERVALGLIERVLLNQSVVKLFSAPGQKTEATVERTGAIVEAEGQGNGNFTIQLPLGFDLKEGDSIFLQGIPRRLLGTVVQIKSDETSSFLTAYVQIPIPLLGNSPVYVEIK